MFTSFFVAAPGLRCCALASPVGVNEGCSLVGVNEGYSLVEVRGLLIVLASLVLEHGP